jgi:ABC-type transport system involved in multi-copper enzyme maturation permease subunit
MLWYKAWLDTRGRFLIGALLLPCAATFMVLAYPRVMGLLPAMPRVDTTGPVGRQIGEALELMRDYRGYVWSQWFRQTPTNVGALFAALLGTGGLVTSAAGGGAALFTLSLPATRQRLIAVRAASGLAQWFALALAASLVIPLVSPIVGQTYAVGTALVHGLCLFVGGSVIYSFALLLSTFFSDLWRPWLITLAATVPVAFAEQMSPELSRFGLFGVMTGQHFFRTGSVPWLGLLGAAAVSVALLYAAALIFDRRDF